MEDERKELEKEKNKIRDIQVNLRKELEEKYKKKLQAHENEMKKKLAQVLGN